MGSARYCGGRRSRTSIVSLIAVPSSLSSRAIDTIAPRPVADLWVMRGLGQFPEGIPLTGPLLL